MQSIILSIDGRCQDDSVSNGNANQLKRKDSETENNPKICWFRQYSPSSMMIFLEGKRI